MYILLTQDSIITNLTLSNLRLFLSVHLSEWTNDFRLISKAQGYTIEKYFAFSFSLILFFFILVLYFKFQFVSINLLKIYLFNMIRNNWLKTNNAMKRILRSFIVTSVNVFYISLIPFPHCILKTRHQIYKTLNCVLNLYI